MRLYIAPLITALLLSIDISTVNSSDSWPKNIETLENGICIVEYFQPQLEIGEIQDKSRIKRKITGILVNDKGLVITSDIIYPANLDIVESSPYYFTTQPLPQAITVSFERDKKLKARFLGKDEDLRMAFLQIEDTDQLPQPVEFNPVNEFNIGDQIYLIEHLNGRFDFENIITTHNVNTIIKKPKLKLLTTKNITALSPGGLVADEDGIAIGVVFRGENYYVHSEYDYEVPYDSESLVQIIPATQFLELLKNPPKLLSQKEGSGKSWLGIQMQELTREMASYWGMDDITGIIINKVTPASPAEKAGLIAGDIIVKLGDLGFQGYDRKNLDVLRNYVRNLPEGEISAEILRDKKLRKLKIRLESAPKSRFLAEEYSDNFLGIGVKELTQDYILNNDLDFNTEGVWVSRIEDAGAASLGGIQINDLILKINDSKIKDLKDFEKNTSNIQDPRVQYIEIFLNRNGKTRFVFIKTLHDDIK
jgi:serine protease Do